MKNRYRKHKSHIIYSMNLNSRRFFMIFFSILFLISSSVTYRFVEKTFQPIVKTLALSETNTLAFKLINDTVSEIGKNLNYSNLCTINKNESGEIISIISNTSEINKTKNQIAEMLIDKSNGLLTEEMGVPIGNLTKTHLLSGRGPLIPIKVLITGSPKIDFVNDFKSAGINQTKHTISLVTTVEIDVILPFENAKTSMTTETMLHETIIVGKIPEVYISR